MQFYIKIFLLFFLLSCQRVHFEGTPTQKEDLEKIKIGLTKEEVSEILGSPDFELKEQNKFVYAYVEKHYRAFLKPKSTKQNVVVFYFSNNILKTISFYDLKDSKTTSFDAQIEGFAKPKLY